MKMTTQLAARRLMSGLQLDAPPIGITFVQDAPQGVIHFNQEVPAACSFWRRAEKGVFYASADKHFNCAIGALTMGFETPEKIQRDLMTVVQKMTDCGYIAPEEVQKIPVVKRKSGGIVYGPLEELPLEPDLVLMWLTPRQAMLYGEAIGMCRWTGEIPKTTYGRPACAALPTALNLSEPTLSVGCAGMRTFTEVSEDKLMAVLPGSRVSEFVDGLESTLRSNNEMQMFYNAHKARFMR